MILTQPFLTGLDSRAAVKGSRDPLGVQPIWSRLGRLVVGNLTTVSSSVRDFTILLLGYHFAERVEAASGGESALATFLKWEQLAAFARASQNGEHGFRGSDRVHRRINDGGKVHIGAAPEYQILGDQQSYGLWGLYTVPSRDSGLVAGVPTRLCDPARELVERVYLPAFAKADLGDGKAIIDGLRRPVWQVRLEGDGRDSRILATVAGIVKRQTSIEREVYREHLLYGGPRDSDPEEGTQGVQRLLAELLAEDACGDRWKLGPASLRTLAARARRRRGEGDAGERLADRLALIGACESVIAPAVSLFEHVLQNDGASPSAVARAVESHWGDVFRETITPHAMKCLEAELAVWAEEEVAATQWLDLGRALRESRFKDAMELVMQRNATVTHARGGSAPWVECRENRLCVRFRDEHLLAMPSAADLPGYWRHAYFIDSLRVVAQTLREKQ